MSRRPARRFSLGLVSFALFGLFLLHGWGLHGSSHEAVGAHAFDSCGPQIGSHDPCHHHPAPAADGGHGLVGLCLAVLGGAVALGLAILAWRHIRMSRAEHPFRPDPIRRRMRGRSPPDLVAIGLIRC